MYHSFFAVGASAWDRKKARAYEVAEYEGKGGGHWTVAATYVENRVTNHKRVYGGASDHWPQRIIDGYGRCRVSIRRTIEMKGCTRTVKADLVAIPRRTSGAAGIAIPFSRPPAYVHYPGTTPTSTRMGRDSIAKHYPYRPTDLLYQLVTISCRLSSPGSYFVFSLLVFSLSRSIRRVFQAYRV